jgi:hypothetical protein
MLDSRQKSPAAASATQAWRPEAWPTMASHLHSIIHSANPEEEEDALSEMAMAVMEDAQARKELAQHFNGTPSEECIIMSILHNGSESACGFVCWALHALAADEELRGSLVSPSVATGLRDALVRRLMSPRSPPCVPLPALIRCHASRCNTMRRYSGPCSACSSSSRSSRLALICSVGAPACGRP